MIRLVLVLLILVVILVTILGFSLEGCFNPKNLIPRDTPVNVDTRTIILNQLQEVRELTITIMSVVTIVSSEQSKQIAGLDVGHNEMLFLGVGKIRAGIDLSKLDENSVRLEDGILFLRLPPVEVLDVALDVEKSQILMRQRSAWWPPRGDELQTAAQRHALQEIRATMANADSIRGAVEEQTTLVVEALLKGLGVEDVRIYWEPEFLAPEVG